MIYAMYPPNQQANVIVPEIEKIIGKFTDLFLLKIINNLS